MRRHVLQLLPLPLVAGGAALLGGLPASTTSPAAGACSVTVVAAGDMAGLSATRETGSLAAAQRPDVVAGLGDAQYPTGSLADYRRAYDSTDWGRLEPKTRPVPGNHDYGTPKAAGYFAYFDPPAAYYAYDLGCGWRAYALNSEISVGTQTSWLRRDLAAHPGVRVLAYWHRPRYSSGSHHGGDASSQPWWDALAGRKVVVLNGHEHSYERFAEKGGIREFVAGTGGSANYPFGPPAAGSQVRISKTPGILRLDLGSGYTWRFVTRSGVKDSGRSS